MYAQKPVIRELTAIRPNHEDAEGALQYGNLLAETLPQQDALADRWNDFLTSESGPVEEGYARDLALTYMLMTAVKANYTERGHDSRKLWADRFTEQTSEVYGIPDARVASAIFADQVRTIREFAEGNSTRNRLDAILEQHGIEVNAAQEHEGPVIDPEIELVGEHLQNLYPDVFKLIEDVDTQEGTVELTDVLEVFKQAVSLLKKYDTAWADWSVVANEDAALLSVEPKRREVIVGMKRVPPSRSELKGLVAHELLVHGLRAVNGIKIDEQLGYGMPGYLDAEEGLGVLIEYAVTGVLPKKIEDRYVDVALALGLVGEKSFTRKELIEFATIREEVRSSQLPEVQQADSDTMRAKVKEAVNRIYRGSRGDDNVGVFTKDIAYYRGYMLMKEYIADLLVGGVKIEDIMNYLYIGKFDPTKEAHKSYVDERMMVGYKHE